jgi:tRNA (guanine37-N1)-methyltransferase
VKNNENVLVMFSGCGPYVLVLAKNTKAKKIVGIEKNPVAHNYALENLRLNKITNAELYLGDVREISLNMKFDRIIMPLPKGAENFLDIALDMSKTGTVVHFYDFGQNTEETVQKIMNFCKINKTEIKILNSVRCGQYSPGTYRFCVDFQILRARQLLP